MTPVSLHDHLSDNRAWLLQAYLALWFPKQGIQDEAFRNVQKVASKMIWRGRRAIILLIMPIYLHGIEGQTKKVLEQHCPGKFPSVTGLSCNLCWLLSTRKVASATEKWKFQCYLIFIYLNLNIYMQLVATTLKNSPKLAELWGEASNLTQ